MKHVGPEAGPAPKPETGKEVYNAAAEETSPVSSWPGFSKTPFLLNLFDVREVSRSVGAKYV